jgi:hypothetical protein
MGEPIGARNRIGVVRRLIGLSLLFIVTGCSALSTPTVVGGTTVTHAGSPPAECSPTQVAQVVRTFLDAFNRGDQAALRGIFQRSVLFTSQNPPPAGFFISGGQQQLLDYFARRHEQHETLDLMALHIQYTDGSAEAGLAPRINRRSDDIAAGVITAKGTLDCKDRAIIAWNQGGS